MLSLSYVFRACVGLLLFVLLFAIVPPQTLPAPAQSPGSGTPVPFAMAEDQL